MGKINDLLHSLIAHKHFDLEKALETNDQKSIDFILPFLPKTPITAAKVEELKKLIAEYNNPTKKETPKKSEKKATTPEPIVTPKVEEPIEEKVVEETVEEVVEEKVEPSIAEVEVDE